MKTYLLIFAPVFLLPCWTMNAGKPKSGSSAPQASSSTPLNEADEAVDDMYDGCDDEMKKKVEKDYFNTENQGIFHEAWENPEVEQCSNKEIEQGNEALTKNHRKAICAYTSKIISTTFNEAVRTSRNVYGRNFEFHYLHYWLTTAIRILKNSQPCFVSFRRTKSLLTGNVNDVIRFGMFASSSTTTDLRTKFGSETCFHIKTCSGASLKNYEMFDSNKEVLIPPYERFRITRVEGRNKVQGLKDCESVYFLVSEEDDVSNTNCELVKENERA